jgi:uncharacterized protein YndB with AHSA1/START domain
MTGTKTLQLTTRGDREIVMTRVFDAPRTLVWDAFTKPELLKRWLYGPSDWSMPVCERGQSVGDGYRYVWRGPKGQEMAAGGVIREISPPERLVVTERFDDPWYPGEAIITVALSEINGQNQFPQTLLKQTLYYESREARDIVVKSAMDTGLAKSYDRLDDVLTAKAA